MTSQSPSVAFFLTVAVVSFLMNATPTQSKSLRGDNTTRLGGCPMMYLPVDGVEGRCFYLSEPGNRYTFFEAKKECEKDSARLYEPIDDYHQKKVEGQFKQRFTADQKKDGDCYWLGFVYMEYKSHYGNISLSPAKWRSITTLEEINFYLADEKYNFACGRLMGGDENHDFTGSYRYLCELEI